MIAAIENVYFLVQKTDTYTLTMIAALTLLTILCSWLVVSCVLPPFGRTLPPHGSGGMITNFKKRLSQDGMERLGYYIEQGADIMARYPPNRFPNGFVMRYSLPIPRKNNMIIVADYKLARIILQGDKELGLPAMGKQQMQSALNLVHRDISNIFTARSADPERERVRKFIAPVFSSTNLSKTTDCLYDHINEFFDIINEVHQKKQQVDVKEELLRLFMKTIGTGALSAPFSIGPKEGFIDAIAYLKDEELILRERIKQAFSPLRQHMFWKKEVKECDDACKRITEAGRIILEMYNLKKQQENAGHNSTADDDEGKGSTGELIISRLVAFKYQEPEEQRRISDLLTFILAGHETTAFTMCFVLMDLAKHPEAQKRVQHEIDTAFGPRVSAKAGVGTKKERPSLADVSKLVYLNWCIKESMRLWPVAGAGSARTLTQSFDYNGFHYQKGDLCILQYFSMFRQPWIDRPDEFIPERWADDAAQIKELRELFMPFSLGPRNCVGMNMANMQLKLIGANILQHFNISLGEKEEEKKIEFEYFLTLKPKDLRMYITPR